MGTTTSERRIRRRMRMRVLTLPREADLSADVAVRVARAALAEHPGATVDRVEVDGDGLYTAHLVTCFGQQVVVPVDADLTVQGWVALAR
jgi:hypothetical protein